MISRIIKDEVCVMRITQTEGLIIIIYIPGTRVIRRKITRSHDVTRNQSEDNMPSNRPSGGYINDVLYRKYECTHTA